MIRSGERANFTRLVLGCIEASKPNFASKYSLESSRRDLHNALLCTAFGIHNRKHRFGIESQKTGKPWAEKNLVQLRGKMARRSSEAAAALYTVLSPRALWGVSTNSNSVVSFAPFSNLKFVVNIDEYLVYFDDFATICQTFGQHLPEFSQNCAWYQN